MPLDHYVSQVHLRKFYSPALGNRLLYAIRKSDLRAFTPDSRAVCGINAGSTNAYLRENRAIENFLETIEPNYNAALDKLSAGEIDRECVYTIAGFAAYVIACSPGGMRTQSEPLRMVVEATAARMDAKGELLPAPAQLGGASLTELVRDGTVEITIDPKYPQAIGIAQILELTATFGNFKWEVLRNEFDDRPFFTSDFPAAIEATSDPRVLNRIVPLAPNLALRIWPDLTLDKDQRRDPSFVNFGYHRRRPSREEVARLNRLIVRGAEETVFYRDDHPWVRPFVSKNRHYRIEPDTQRLTTPAGTWVVSTLRIVARPDAHPERVVEGPG